MTRHEAELLCKKKVTRKLMDELYTAPPPSGRPATLRLKPSRYVAWNGGSCTPKSPSGSCLASNQPLRHDVPLPGRTQTIAPQGDLGCVAGVHTRTWLWLWPGGEMADPLTESPASAVCAGVLSVGGAAHCMWPGWAVCSPGRDSAAPCPPEDSLAVAVEQPWAAGAVCEGRRSGCCACCVLRWLLWRGEGARWVVGRAPPPPGTSEGRHRLRGCHGAGRSRAHSVSGRK